MRVLLALAALLAACGDDAPVAVDAPPVIDARPDTPWAPAINWDEFGAPCDRTSYGAVGCHGTQGGGGVCVLDGSPDNPSSGPPFAAHCLPACQSLYYMHECPPDAIIVDDPHRSQGCWCVKR